jgi:hypothetical protein
VSQLNKRLAKLEGKTSADDLVLIIQRFGAGEYRRAKGPCEQMIERLPNEREEAFLVRASDEIVSSTKRDLGPQPYYIVQPLRDKENALATTPQMHPILTRDEWMVAHGLLPIAGEQAQ